MGRESRRVGRPERPVADEGEATKKEEREADGTGSGSSGENFREKDLASNSVDDARRLYVTKDDLVRTDSKKECE